MLEIAGYTTETGATWSGNVEKATFTVITKPFERYLGFRGLLEQNLADLPPDQRRSITLAYFGGYTHAEISEQWNIPLGTVKGRMRLGMQKLKLLLQEDGIDML